MALSAWKSILGRIFMLILDSRFERQTGRVIKINQYQDQFWSRDLLKMSVERQHEKTALGSAHNRRNKELRIKNKWFQSKTVYFDVSDILIG